MTTLSRGSAGPGGAEQRPTAPLDEPAYGIGVVAAVGRGVRKYATFSGRVSRSEYWWWVLATVVIMFALLALGALFGVLTSPGPVGADGGRTLGWLATPFLVLAGAWISPNAERYGPPPTLRPPWWGAAGPS